MKVYKYELKVVPEQKIEIQSVEKILFIKTVNGVPHIWFLYDDSTSGSICIQSVMTGENMSSNVGKYIGKYVLNNGIVVHVFAK